MGAVALSAVAIGFGRTYALPMTRGTFSAPPAVHIHGAFAAGWLLLFIVQPLLVRMRRVRWHRYVGRAGLPLAIGVAVTMLPAGHFQVTRDLAAGGGPSTVSNLGGILTTGILFLCLVTAGIIARRDREAHARWMLLATLLVVWPAYFRFRHYFPSVPRPDIWFGLVLAFSWIVVAMIHDRMKRGAVHPVLMWGGIFVIVEQSGEILMFDSWWWRAAAEAMYAWIGRTGMV
jgi:hypothetical protein